MAKTKFPDVFKWLCGRCDTWNPIEAGVCKKCNGMIQHSASAYRLHNILTPEERNAYQGTLPAILNELSAIRKILEERKKNGEIL
jgi:hypothetical protein